MAKEFACQPGGWFRPKLKQTNGGSNGTQPAANLLRRTRQETLRDQLFRVMSGLGTKLPIIGADLNCVISVKDIEVGRLQQEENSRLN